ncbi:MAG: head GIN domain-containing protein [Chloroflexota bacterium]|nr:head GIN domain-containing protein [Chloroflexota bacterium]
MRKYKHLILAVFILVLVTLACSISLPGVDFGSESVRGSGDVSEEERLVGGITSVSVANQGDLYIELGEQEKLVIEAEDNLLEYIESDVRGGELVLETSSEVNIRNTKPIRYYLTVKVLEEIAVYSSGDIDAPEFEVDSFTIDVNSSGDVKVDGLDVTELRINISSSGEVTVGELVADQLDVTISSSGNLTIREGGLEEQDISIRSSGDYDARNVQSQRATVRISSSGDVTIRVSNELEARLSSSGDLYYIGNPSVDARESSSGDVIQIK